MALLDICGTAGDSAGAQEEARGDIGALTDINDKPASTFNCEEVAFSKFPVIGPVIIKAKR